MYPKPILSLSTCQIRHYCDEDIDSLSRAANNPQIAKWMRNTFPSPYTTEDARKWISELASPYDFVICTPDGSTLMGGVGLKKRSDIHHRTMEIGYWVGEEHWGKGIASEVVKAFAEWAFAEYDSLLRLEGEVFEGNAGSCRVLEKAGFKLEGKHEMAVEKDGVIAANNTAPEVFVLTSRLLRLNPEYYTVWNDRRRLLICGSLSAPSAGSSPSRALPTSSPTDTTTLSSAVSSSSSSTTTQPYQDLQKTGSSGTTVDDGIKTREDTIRSELAFTIPLLMEFPKCYWIWNYRLWVLGKAVELLDRVVSRGIWTEELGLVGKMLTRDRRNFHAWGYRRHVVAQLESAALSPDGKSPESLVVSEFEYTSKMIRVDLSNFSAWHNRSKLIPRLLDERQADDVARRKFLEDELNLVREALNVGPEDQSLWYYHQFLMLNLFDAVDSSAIAPNLNVSERVAYVTRELDDIKDLLEDYEDIKWLYEALLEYTVALAKLESRSLSEHETEQLRGWLVKLQQLDRTRRGRWAYMRSELGLS
ncbi:hypothetical protein PoMZ_08222 [Pyricularia oryzae]|uniref:Geranylgeranyl transferase type-2 subunit alpha n=1 Tax=Pyricularia oryzae TaxID=318829 RepID=A0A4P7NH28_PYROR|nr:hypothetical protein PoMZ_08222 [Pyricularia oryzae]